VKSIIKICAVLSVFFIGNLSAQAEDYPCEKIHSLATQVMEVRQLGAAMPGVMSAVMKDLQTEQGKKIVRSMIIDAYDRPQYSGYEYQKNEAKRFANEWAVKCYKQ